MYAAACYSCCPLVTGSAKKVVLSQPTPRRSAKPTVTPASDSEEGEDAAQASLRAVVSSMMAKLSPDDKDRCRLSCGAAQLVRMHGSLYCMQPKQPDPILPATMPLLMDVI